MVPSSISTEPSQRTYGASFITLPGEPAIWAHFLDPHPMFIYTPPPSPAERAATCYAATLAIHDYDEAVRDALREGDDAEARNCLEVIRAIVDVAIGQLPKPSSENRVLQ